MDPRSPVDVAVLRSILGQFATGVTVITVQHAGRIHGMTANSFTSVSLDPPLVLFCVARSARMASFVKQAHGFAINILGAHQQEVSRQFAGSKKDDLATNVHLGPGPIAPLIQGSLASISCTVEALHDGGDHWIVVGRVINIVEGPQRAPLVFFRSRYHDVIESAPLAPAEPGEMWTNDAIRIYHDEWSVDEQPASDDERNTPPW
jgi:flavin reductase (DIM6/NTAB) family NADH-FMN oxidoreductase RutF